jgi:hypothetical protein
VLSQVSRDTERLLRARLKTAPRSIAAGLPVLAIENGRFEVVAAPSEEGFVMALGPSESRELFDEVVASLKDGGPADPLSASELLTRVRTLGKSPEVLVVALPRGVEGAWFGAVGKRDGAGMKVDYVAGSPALSKQAEGVKEWSLRKFNAIAEGSLATVVEWDAGPPELRAGEALAGRVLPPLPAWLDLAELRRLCRGRVAVRVSAGVDGPLDAAIALQTSDVAALAVRGDASMGELIARLDPTPKGERLAPMNLGGAVPQTLRTVDLAGLVQPFTALGWTRGPDLAWTYRSGGLPEGGDASGWWTVGLGAGAVQTLADRVSAPEPEEERVAWLSVGMVRPAALLAVLEARNVRIPKEVGPLRWIAEVRWRTIRLPQGLVQGHGGIELVKPEPPPAGDEGR